MMESCSSRFFIVSEYLENVPLGDDSSLL